MTSAIGWALALFAAIVFGLVSAERHKRRELKRLEKVFPVSGEQDDN